MKNPNTNTNKFNVPTVQLTEKEFKVVEFLIEELEPWIGSETYSPLEVSDIAKGLGSTPKSIRGIIGSLTKKEVVYSYDHEAGDGSSKVMMLIGLSCQGDEGITQEFYKEHYLGITPKKTAPKKATNKKAINKRTDKDSINVSASELLVLKIIGKLEGTFKDLAGLLLGSNMHMIANAYSEWDGEVDYKEAKYIASGAIGSLIQKGMMIKHTEIVKDIINTPFIDEGFTANNLIENPGKRRRRKTTNEKTGAMEFIPTKQDMKDYTMFEPLVDYTKLKLGWQKFKPAGIKK